MYFDPGILIRFTYQAMHVNTFGRNNIEKPHFVSVLTVLKWYILEGLDIVLIQVLCWLSVEIFEPLSVVGKSQLIIKNASIIHICSETLDEVWNS